MTATAEFQRAFLDELNPSRVRATCANASETSHPRNPSTSSFWSKSFPRTRHMLLKSSRHASLPRKRAKGRKCLLKTNRLKRIFQHRYSYRCPSQQLCVVVRAFFFALFHDFPQILGRWLAGILRHMPKWHSVDRHMPKWHSCGQTPDVPGQFLNYQNQ